MLVASDSKRAPWYRVHSDDERKARLNCISQFVSMIQSKKVLGRESNSQSVPKNTVTTIKNQSRDTSSYPNDIESIEKARDVYSTLDASSPKEADLASFPNSDTDSDASKIAALWEAWNAALKASDANSLVALMTDDVVFVHGNGQCVCGKKEVQSHIANSFGRFDIDRRYLPAETVVVGKWAIEIRELETTLTTVRGGIQLHASSRTLIVFVRQADASWKVTRVLELLG
jgi:uncharacterized protein (TIGR02246 family)